MKALLSALLSARQAAPELPRDERSSIRGADGRDKPIDYPSDSEVQRAAAGLGRVGLLLLPEGIEPTQDGKALTCSWSLIHIESGERLLYAFSWPLPSDLANMPHHQQAAAWTHAERHLVIHLLALRVAPRLPVDDLAPALGGRGVPTPSRTLASPAPYSPAALDDLVVWWALREQEFDRAEGRVPIARTMGDAFGRYSGGLPREPVNDAERKWLFERLCDEQRRRA